MNPPPSFSELLAEWRAGRAECGLESYVDLLTSHPAIDRLISAGPCCPQIFDAVDRRYIFCSQAATVVHRCEPEVIINSNFEYFKAHLSAQDLILFGKRGLRYHQKTLHYSTPQRLNAIKMHLYTLHFPDNTSQVMIGQDIVLKCDDWGTPYLMLSVSAIADNLPDLAERLQQQTLEDSETDMPIRDVPLTALEKYFKPIEAKIIQLIASGKGNPQVAEELDLPMTTLMRMIKDILKRTHSYSILDLLEKRVWEKAPTIDMPIW